MADMIDCAPFEIERLDRLSFSRQCSVTMTTGNPNPGPIGKTREDRLAEQELKRRRGRPERPPAPPLSKALFKTLQPILKETGSGVGALEARWEEIVGARMAKLSRPVKIIEAKTGYVLVIEAPSAASPMLQHQSGLIIQRVNLSGGANIKAIRLQQTVSKPEMASRKKKADRRALSPEQAKALDAALTDIQSDTIRQALRELGEALFTRQ